jgi:hypothetical protein
MKPFYLEFSRMYTDLKNISDTTTPPEGGVA